MKSKIRVYEYAKQINKTSKEVINKIKELELPVSNHMSTISDDMKTKLDQSFQPKPKEQPKEQPKKKQAKNQPNTKPNNNQSSKKQMKNNNKQQETRDKKTN